jgi:type III restriction enzyme
MPAFSLKTYQSQALQSLERFLAAAGSSGSLAHAFAQELRRNEPDEAKSLPPYRADPFGDTPCVCLRIPTGGGKTLLASHAITLMARCWRQADFPVALWLVPSTTIRDQTLRALQQPGHAYRAALEAAYGQALMVLDLDATPTIAAQDLGRKAIVLVATMQSFRVRQTQGRNVYAFSEDFDAHFAHFRSLGALAGPAAERLEKVGPADLAEVGQAVLGAADLGRVKHSLANLLALASARSWSSTRRTTPRPTPPSPRSSALAPSAILELTATPGAAQDQRAVQRGRARTAGRGHGQAAGDAGRAQAAWPAAVRDAALRRRHLEAEGGSTRRPTTSGPSCCSRRRTAPAPVTPEVLRQHLHGPKSTPAERRDRHRHRRPARPGRPGPLRPAAARCGTSSPWRR